MGIFFESQVDRIQPVKLFQGLQVWSVDGASFNTLICPHMKPVSDFRKLPGAKGLFIRWDLYALWKQARGRLDPLFLHRINPESVKASFQCSNALAGAISC